MTDREQLLHAAFCVALRDFDANIGAFRTVADQEAQFEQLCRSHGLEKLDGGGNAPPRVAMNGKYLRKKLAGELSDFCKYTARIRPPLTLNQIGERGTKAFPRLRPFLDKIGYLNSTPRSSSSPEQDQEPPDVPNSSAESTSRKRSREEQEDAAASPKKKEKVNDNVEGDHVDVGKRKHDDEGDDDAGPAKKKGKVETHDKRTEDREDVATRALKDVSDAARTESAERGAVVTEEPQLTTPTQRSGFKLNLGNGRGKRQQDNLDTMADDRAAKRPKLDV
jgi:hypothetical protein